MGTTGAVSMVLGHTLLTTRNKHSLLASCKDGVPSECILSAFYALLIRLGLRCTIPLGDPNGQGVRRCREHTEALVEELQLGVLWDEYGLVGDIVVDAFHYILQCFTTWIVTFVALHERFPSRRYPRAPRS
jgi:hypothetical protein